MTDVFESFFASTGLTSKALEEHERLLARQLAWVSDSNRSSPVEAESRGFWEAFAEARRIAAHAPLPADAWQGERVMSTVSQLGRTRPVYMTHNQGAATGCLDAGVCFDPDWASGCDRLLLASVLVHEATHVTFDEMIGERFGLTPEESFVLFTVNDRARYRLHVLQELLAYWNQAAWLERQAPGIIDTGAANRLVRLSAGSRHGGAEDWEDLAENLHLLTVGKLLDEPHGRLEAPIVGWRGGWAGHRLPIEDLAPGILVPFIETHEALGLQAYEWQDGRERRSMFIDPWRDAILIG